MKKIAPLWKEYRKKISQLWEEYKQEKAQLLKEYQGKQTQLLREYEEKHAQLLREYRGNKVQIQKADLKEIKSLQAEIEARDRLLKKLMARLNQTKGKGDGSNEQR
jgi:molybdenum-dependent DNA-binding transcriptional regulator ModE